MDENENLIVGSLAPDKPVNVKKSAWSSLLKDMEKIGGAVEKIYSPALVKKDIESLGSIMAGLKLSLAQTDEETVPHAHGGLGTYIPGLEITYAPNYPDKKSVTGYELIQGRKQKKEDGHVRNRWIDRRTGDYIYVVEDKDRVFHHRRPKSDDLTHLLLGTVMAGESYSLAAEIRAMKKLKTMLPKRRFMGYVASGVLVERSKRSGVSYYIRRARPTLAFRNSANGSKFLASMCFHPGGYYKETWAGILCPTDEVIAHLLMVRGDEKMFWRKSNQHSMSEVEAGMV